MIAFRPWLALLLATVPVSCDPVGEDSLHDFDGDGWEDADCSDHVSSTTDWVRVAAGFDQVDLTAVHGCGVTIEGYVVCWGLNNAGQSRPP